MGVTGDRPAPSETVLRLVVPAQFPLAFHPAQQDSLRLQLGWEVKQQRGNALEIKPLGREPAEYLAQTRFQPFCLGPPTER